MKILIYGAGTLGSVFAARLAEAGHDVSLLARGQRLDDLRQHGIILENSVTGEQERTPINAVEALEPEDDYELVMIVMRKNHALQILPTLATNKRVPTYLFMMNDVSGPEAFVEAVGRERVMRGFPLPGGKREDPVVKVVPDNDWRPWELPIGEVDGSITPRTRRVAAVLEEMRGYEVDIRTDIDAWLKYHYAIIGPLAMALYAADTDQERMARTRDALVLGTRGMKEALSALRTIGVPPSPAVMRVFEWLPEPLLIWIIQKFLSIESLKAGLEGHAKAAPDEMQYLTDEFRALVHNGGAVTPMLDRLYIYFDQDTPRIPDGSRQIPMRWHGLVIPALLLVALNAGIAALILGRKDHN